MRELPPSIQELAQKYPLTIASLSKVYWSPHFQYGYSPRSIEVFFGEKSNSPGVWFFEGKLKIYDLSSPLDKDVIRVFFDRQLAYVQIEGLPIFDRIGGTVIPPFFSDIYLHLNCVISKVNKKKRQLNPSVCDISVFLESFHNQRQALQQIKEISDSVKDLRKILDEELKTINSILKSLEKKN
jgi:hypothetical protein